MPTKPESPIVVVALFWNDRGEILAVSRKDNHEDLGLPGGKVDPTDATIEDAIVREVREEVGVEITRLEVVFDHPDREFQAYTFLVHEWRGEPKAMERAAVLWAPPARLLEPSCSFRDYNEALFKHLGVI